MKEKTLSFWQRWQKMLRNAFWPRGGWQKELKRLPVRLLRLRSNPHAVALGFSVGAFVSFTPLIGLHFLFAAAIAWIVRANIVAALIGTVVGNPFTFPFIFYGSYQIGWRIIEGSAPAETLSSQAASMFWTTTLGGVVLGAAAALLCYIVIYLFLTGVNKRRELARARRFANDAEGETQ